MTVDRNDFDRSAQANAIMDDIQRHQAGRLTVFLGAAPGVGKTFAMLVRAHELQRQGKDVVVGIVETHGRQETLALLDGLTLIPRKRLEHQARWLEEMDLDALLQRKPQVVLVDEFAHRNVPGSRHERRWQDVEELLDAGIDVYTTVNIQHLESLNDVVYQITGVRVSETVPDRVFDRLRDIRLVDLPARELIERLNAGKVYVPEQVPHALQGFFSPSNLTALRELAMQTVAAHVDSDFRDSYTARGLVAIPLQQHLLIAIDGYGNSEYLVRAGCRMAERRGALWTVVTVENDSEQGIVAPEESSLLYSNAAPAQHKQKRLLELDQAFALARQLGGNVARLHGVDVAATLLDAAADRAISSIMIGRTHQRPVAQLFNQTLAQQLLKRGGQYDLTIISAPGLRQKTARSSSLSDYWPSWRESLFVVFTSVAGVAIAMLAEQWVGLTDLSMVFIITVLVVASRSSMLASVITALLCFFSYNFFFIEPRYTFQIEANQGVITVTLFLFAALIASRLASRLRSQVVALRSANAYSTSMQELSSKLSVAADMGQVMQAAQAVLQQTLRANVWFYLPATVLDQNTPDDLKEKDKVAADWALKHAQACGRFTDTLSASGWLFLPLLSEQQAFGVVGLKFSADMSQLGFEQRRLAESMLADIAQAMLRTRLVADLEAARVSSETERLRSALLSSVSHDLRSPLASMIGSADSLASYGQAMSEADKQELLQTIRLEGERLDRYIQNLLDMTRLGHQGLSLKRDWIGVDELIGSATRRLIRYKPDTKFDIQLPADIPQLYVHPALIEQAIFNVLENAEKFSPPDKPIGIVVTSPEENRLQIDMADQGAGIPEQERQAIFDMFYSMQRGDRGSSGTGLGLTIVKAIVGAHMGSIEALSGPQGTGTVVRMTLPIQPH